MVQHSAFAAIVLTAVFLCLNQVTETDNSEISLPQLGEEHYPTRLLFEENTRTTVNNTDSNSTTIDSLDTQNKTAETPTPTNANSTIYLPLTPAMQGFRALQGFSFEGRWKNDLADQKIRPFNDITLENGKIWAWFKLFKIINETAKSARDSEATVVRFFNGEYADDPFYFFRIFDATFDDKKSYRFLAEGASIIVINKTDSSETNITCQMKLEVDFSRMINVSNGRIELNLQAEAPFYLKSQNCTLSASGLLTIPMKLENQITSYTFMLTIITIVSFYCIGQIVKHIISNPSDAKKYSILSIGFSTIWDAYICFSHLNIALMRDNWFHLFIMPIFLFFVLFSVFDMKLLVELWRHRYEHFYQTNEQLRRGIMAFNIKFYGALFIALMLFNQFKFHPVFVFFSSLILVPQIAHNAMRAERTESNHPTLYLLAFFKLLIPLYIKGCPESIYGLRPSVPTMAIILTSVIFQIVILELQAKLGKKFFIPRRFLPPKYNYLTRIPVAADLESGYEHLNADDCAICMGSLAQEAIGAAELTGQAQLYYNELRPRQNDLMRTPCDHKFHVPCLLNWMVIKMECPSCRSQLPSID